MIFAIFTSILESFSEIFRKKTLINRVPEYLNTLFWYSTWLLFVIYFIFNIDFSSVNYLLFIIIFFMSLIDVINSKISQSIYREEKISVLMPYTNISNILTIILSFFIFSDVSVITFSITIFTILVIILFSIDFKILRFPRNILKMFFSEIITTFICLLVWYIIIHYSDWILFVFDFTMWTTILIILSLYFWYFSHLKKINNSYYLPRLTWSFLWWWSYALSLIIISNLWLSVSILLWFIWMWITLLLSFLILKDKPWKKDLILTVIVTVLVWIWYYFK